MADLPEDEQRRLMTAPPRGTLVLMLLLAAAFLAAWLYLYFGVYWLRGLAS